MKRCRHIPLALTLLALLAVPAMWVRSYWRLDLLWRVHDDGSTAALVSYQGALHFIAAGTNGRTRKVQWDVYRIPAGATYATLHRYGTVRWAHVGFARVQQPLLTAVTLPPPTTRVVPLVVLPAGGIGRPYGASAVAELTPWLSGIPYDALIIPYWPIALLAASYPMLRTIRAIRAAIRRRWQGRCPNCGYDLRASPDRCPECGAAVVRGSHKLGSISKSPASVSTARPR